MIKNNNIPDNNASKEKNKSLKTLFIKFRVDYDTYNLLRLKSLENKMGNKPHKYVRKVIEDHLILNDSKVIKKSLVTLNDEVTKNRSLIIQLLKWSEYFTQSFFASVPEIPEDAKEEVGETAQRRMKRFFELMASIKLGEGNTMIEKIIMDILQKEENK